MLWSKHIASIHELNLSPDVLRIRQEAEKINFNNFENKKL